MRLPAIEGIIRRRLLVNFPAQEPRRVQHDLQGRHQAVLAAVDQDPTLELTDAIAFAPDTAWESFSYVTEHVSHVFQRVQR